MSDHVADLLNFIDRSPTPYHAVAETERRLQAAGFQRLREDLPWDQSAGSRSYVIRNDGSLVAFEAGAIAPASGGFRIVGSHTDSPNLRLKPNTDIEAHGYRQFAVEVYGGVLLHTWLDRDLSLAGRVSVERDGGVEDLLVDFARPIMRIPNLAIHLNREVRESLVLNAQQHLVPIAGMEDAPSAKNLISSELRAQGIAEVQADEILAYDLMAYDTQPACVAGVRGEFIQASRLDNLASCHAGVTALLRACESGIAPFTRMVALYDHEEVGSRSAQGAAGTLLADTLERIVEGYKGGEAQGVARAISLSTLISADMAHAVHPNYSDRHEPGHRPVIGQGPVIKVNASQAYATDSATAAMFAALCKQCDVGIQHFVSRSDLPCGSTIGPITAARVGIRTVDVGNPMLSMHSCREMAGTADVDPFISVLSAYFEGSA